MGFLISLFAGPFAGILGSIISGFVSYFERKQEIEADKARYAHELKLQEMNIAARGQEMEHEADIAQMHADTQMLSDSYIHDASYGEVYTWAATALRFVRPVLTIGLIALVWWIYNTVADGGLITIGDETMTVREKIVASVLFMAEAALTWWFADRRRGNK
ncbi:MAG TPA: hypothetical protein VKA19_10580 [Alphaproteobacteria bacterium]|nr:hypothetical protein [Alphaproteobacteria bacterium]